MDSLEIINRIAEKGGLIGACAKYYRDDELLAGQFIHECFHYCKFPTAKNLWGEPLINEIVTFVSEKKEQKAVSFLRN